MVLGRLWAGQAYGTNTGNLFVRLEGDDARLDGTLHLNEPGVGVVVYAIQGSFDGNCLAMTGKPQTQIEGIALGQLDAAAVLDTRGTLNGEWETSIGSAGTFVLFPHDQTQAVESNPSNLPDQLHTVRHHFQAVELDRQQITAIADEIQRDFKNAQVVVIVAADTEQSRFLSDFKTLNFSADRAAEIKLFVREPEVGGLDRIALVEFGPQINMAMTQGGDEAWVLGMLEKLKRSIRPLERSYTTNFKRLGFGINQLLVVGAIIFLPGLGSLRDRAILMAAVLALTFAINWLHGRYLPFAAIYLGKKPAGLFARFAPTAASWLIAATASIVAALVAAYLQGWLAIPTVKL